MRLLRILLALAAAGLAAPIAAEPIELPAVGFSIDRPNSWTQLTAEEGVSGLERVDFHDPAMRDRVVAAGNRMLVTLIREGDGLSVYPTIKVIARMRAETGSVSPVQLLEGVAALMTRNFADTQIEEGPVTVQRFGRQATYMRLSYTLSTEGQPTPVKVETWIVPTDNFVVVLSVSAHQDEPPAIRAEIDAVLATVRFERQTGE